MAELKPLKIGKKYKVKSFERLIREYGKDGREMPNVRMGFNNEMKRLCGSIITIISSSVFHDKAYTIEEDKSHWSWTSQMVENSPLEELIYRRKHG